MGLPPKLTSFWIISSQIPPFPPSPAGRLEQLMSPWKVPAFDHRDLLILIIINTKKLSISNANKIITIPTTSKMKIWLVTIVRRLPRASVWPWVTFTSCWRKDFEAVSSWESSLYNHILSYDDIVGDFDAYIVMTVLSMNMNLQGPVFLVDADWRTRFGAAVQCKVDPALVS